MDVIITKFDLMCYKLDSWRINWHGYIFCYSVYPVYSYITGLSALSNAGEKICMSKNNRHILAFAHE